MADGGLLTRAGMELGGVPAELLRELLGTMPTRGAGDTPGLILPRGYAPSGQPPQDYVATSNFPQTALVMARATITANQGLIGGGGWRVPANGTVFLSGTITGSAATFTYTTNGGASWSSLNGGTALTVNASSDPLPIMVVQNQRIDFSASASTTATNLVAFYVPTLAAAGGGGSSGGGSGAPTSASAPKSVTVGTSAVRLDSGLSGRTSIVVVNNGSAAIYLGFGSVSSSLTTSNGIPLAASGGATTLPLGAAVAVYGISGTAGQDVRVVEFA